MTFTQNTNRLAEALARLPQQFKAKNNFEKLITVFQSQFEEIEVVLEQLYNDLNIDDAEGSQLDIWGEILDVDRAGQTDSVYRTRLKAAIFRYVSSGKWEEMLQGFVILTNPRYVQAGELFPAAVEFIGVGVNDPTAISPTETFNAMDDLRPAGVRISQLIVASDNPFVFFGDPDAFGIGFGDRLDTTQGGYFAERLIG